MPGAPSRELSKPESDTAFEKFQVNSVASSVCYHFSVEKQKPSHIENKPVVTSEEWEGGRGKVGVCGGPGHSCQSPIRRQSFHCSGHWLYLLGVWTAQGPPQCVFHPPREQLSWKALNTFLRVSRIRIRIRVTQRMAIPLPASPLVSYRRI